MTKLFLGVLTAGLLTSQGIAGQPVDRSAEREGESKQASIQGVWQAVEVTITGPGARTIAIPEPRPNLTIITARHYSRVEDQSERPRLIPADVTRASADELRAVWGPFVGEAGTYEVTNGNLITMRPIASKNPAVMGPACSSCTWGRRTVGHPTAKPEWAFANPFTSNRTSGAFLEVIP